MRRRRAGLAAGGFVAASAVVVATALAVLPGSDSTSDRSPVATDPGEVGTVDVSWIEGSTLHRATWGDVDLGREAVAFVRTSVGYVFADATGAVFSVVGADVERIGRTEPTSIKLVSDPLGPRAVWLDVGDTGVVVFDQSSGADLTLEGRFTDDVAVLTAVDGDTAYAKVGNEARSLDLVTGKTSVVADDGSRVLDGSGDLLALGRDSGVRLSRAGVVTTLPDTYGAVGSFSPDGAFFTSDADVPHVVSVATGNPVTFDAPDYFATGYEWLDEETLVMITQADESFPVELQICRVPKGTCTPAAELYSFPELKDRGFVLPSGEPTDY